MSTLAKSLIDARSSAPCPGVSFDAWLIPLIIEALEPVQADILLWIIAANGEMTSEDVTQMARSTPQRTGSAVSDLRKLGLVTSTPITGGSTRATLHRVVAWVCAAWAWHMQEIER